MSKINVNVLVAARDEYILYLLREISPTMYDIIKDIYEQSQLLKRKRSVSLKNFQICLKEVPEWNQFTIDRNFEKIKNKCPYIENLITAVFVTNVKILSCIKLNTSGVNNIDVTVPNLNNFLHKILIKLCENIYYNPKNIFMNKEIFIQNISKIIEDIIRNELPLEKILNEYLLGVFENNNEEIASEGGHSSNSQLNDIGDIKSVSDIESEPDKLNFGEQADNQEDNDEEFESKNILTTKPIPDQFLNKSEPEPDADAPEKKDLPGLTNKRPEGEEKKNFFNDSKKEESDSDEYSDIEPDE